MKPKILVFMVSAAFVYMILGNLHVIAKMGSASSLSRGLEPYRCLQDVLICLTGL